jgi:hypothetical protein
MVTFFILFQVSSIAIAWLGYSMSHWEPEKIQELSKNEVHELNMGKCLVTSYKSDDPRSQAKKLYGNFPDKRDEMILVRGEFAKKGQKDLIVLCKSLDNGKEFFQVIWGGPAKCESKLMMSNVSRFMKERLSESNSYISYLKGRQPSETLKLQNSHAEEFRKNKEVWSSMGLVAKQWILEASKTPKLEHNTMWFDGASSFAFYCDGNKWIQLYDALQDGEP